MASMEDSQPPTMEQLLKEAMLLHRNTVKELTETKEKYNKVQLSKKSLLDKARALQRDCRVLKQENKHLKGVKETLTGRSDDSGCKTCQFLQQSMEALKDAYTKTIEEKDRAIRMLEERLAEKNQVCNKSSISDDGKEPSSVSRGVRGECKGTSPDTTSNRGDRKSVSPDKLEDQDSNLRVREDRNPKVSPGSCQQSEDVCSGSRRNNLKLPKDRQKRSRYAETPLSGVLVKGNTRLKARGPERLLGEDSNSKVSQSVSCRRSRSNVTKEASNRTWEKELVGNLLLPDTCKPETCEDSPQKSAKRPRIAEGDGSYISEIDSPGKLHPRRELQKNGAAQPNVIVPETLAVDYFDDVDGGNSDCSEDETNVKTDKRENLETVSLKFEDNTEQICLGSPTASSTQIIMPITTTTNEGKSSCTGHVSKDMSTKDTTVINRFQPDVKKLSLDVTKVNTKNNLSLDEDELPMSPVFIGVKKTQLKSADDKSPSLFDDDNKMVEQGAEISQYASLLDDSESPFLLRRLPCSGQKLNMPEDLSDGDTGSPSLLHSKDAQKSTGTSNQSGALSQNSRRKSNRKIHGKRSAPEFKQTTLTQSLDWSMDKPRKTVGSNRIPELQEIQNLESRLSSPSLLSGKKSKTGDTGSKGEDPENCHLVSEFKKPISPLGKRSKTRSPPKMKLHPQVGYLVPSTPKKICEFDPDETVPPEVLQMSLRDLPKGDNMQQQCNQPASSVPEDHNASIDPAVQLSVDYPDTLAYPDDPRSPLCVKQRSKIDPFKGKTLEEESQALPSSSKSFKFVPGQPTPKLQSEEAHEGELSNEAQETGVSQSKLESGGIKEKRELEASLNCSYDRVPRKKGPGYAYVDVVRKRGERQKLKGYFCQECEDYFKDVGLSEEERAQRMQQCSRHRARYVPPNTPEHFWSIGFPDTPECEERGYIKKDSPKGPSRFRRKKRLEKRFKGKTEEKEEINGNPKSEDLNSSNLIFDL